MQKNPYKIRVILEDTPNLLFKLRLGEEPSVFRRASYWLSEVIFKNLVIKNQVWRSYSIILIIAVVILSFEAVISQFFALPITTSIVNLVYIFLFLLVIPLLVYFVDFYQAMELRLGMSKAVSEAIYHKEKKRSKFKSAPDEKEKKQSRFEWVPANLAMLNAILQNKREYSHSELGKIARVGRSTAVGAEKKLLDSGLVYDDGGIYRLSNLEFEVLLRKYKKLEHIELNDDEKKRLKHLFEVMCFEAF
jgi:hypothetical protein